MDAPPEGLCESCRHCKRVASARGSEFRLCRLSEGDARFVKYPRLPVLTCGGYERAPEGPEPSAPPSPRSPPFWG